MKDERGGGKKIGATVTCMTNGRWMWIAVIVVQGDGRQVLVDGPRVGRRRKCRPGRRGSLVVALLVALFPPASGGRLSTHNT